MVLYCDLETYAATDIKVGAYRYAQDAEVLLWAYAVDDGEPTVWDLTRGDPMPVELAALLGDPDVMTVWHNGAGFDRLVLKHALNIDLPVSRIHDTMVQALSHSLPGSLADLCNILNVPQDIGKLADGKKLVQRFCKPAPKGHKAERYTRETHPTEWVRFMQYAANDITAMRAVLKRLPKWNYPGLPRERLLFELDQTINDRGIRVDVDLAQSAVSAVEQAKRVLNQRTRELTNGEVESTSRISSLNDYLKNHHGVVLENMQAATLERLVAEATLPEEVLEVLRIRLQASASSTAKYLRFIESTGHDLRLRGMLQFCGASRTGRWSSRIVQLQNLPRQDMKPEEVEQGIEAIKAGAVDLFYENVMAVASEALRGCLVAEPGKRMVVADLSNIEGRVLAWIGGEKWKLNAFQAFDEGKGEDLYKVAYSRAYGINAKNVTKDQRQIGKVMELACLAGDTLVLTKEEGYIPIVSVTPKHQVWDGESWVQQQGVVARGVKKVVHVANTVALTEDHLVLIGETWRPAKQLVSNVNTLRQALATGSANLPSSERSARNKARVRKLCTAFNAVVERLSILSPRLMSERGVVHGVMSALKRKRNVSESYILATTTLFLTPNTEGAYLTGLMRPALGATARPLGSTMVTAAEAYMFGSLGVKTELSSLNTSSLLMTGISQSTTWIGLTLTKATSRATSVLYRVVRTAAAISERLGLYKERTTNYAPVFDLLNCGPKNRFTILSSRGPLLVHNCGYQGGAGAFATFADAYGIDLDELAERALPSLPAVVVEDSKRLYKKLSAKGQTRGMTEQAWVVCDGLKVLWRKAHPGVVELWSRLEDTAIKAVRNPGKRYDLGLFSLMRNDNWLRIKLPSGRYLCYPAVRLDEKEGTLSYAGVNQFTRRWERVTTYGGKLVENCIAEGSLVLTDSGFKPIENIGPSDLVHDGIQWVRHAGLINKGVQPVVEVDGVWMTPDHGVLTNEGWRAASQNPEPYRPDLRNLDGVGPCAQRWSEKVLALCLPLRRAMRQGWNRCEEGSKTRWHAQLRVFNQNIDRKSQHKAWDVKAPGLRCLSVDGRQVQTAYASGMEELRSAWHQSLSTVAGVFRELLGGHGRVVPAWSGLRPHRQQQRIHPGELPVGAQTNKLHEPQKQRSGCGRADVKQNLGYRDVNDLLPTTSRRPGGTTDRPSRCRSRVVYDILDAGPLHRFVVKGAGGVFIVHNCCQAIARDVLANGMTLAELDGFDIVATVHDELICEAPDFDDHTHTRLAKSMATRPQWAPDLPLAADGFTSYRYRK